MRLHQYSSEKYYNQTPIKKPQHESNTNQIIHLGDNNALHQQSPSYSTSPIRSATPLYQDRWVDDDDDIGNHLQYNLSLHSSLKAVSSSSSKCRLRVKPDDKGRPRRSPDPTADYHCNSRVRKVEKSNRNFDHLGEKRPQHGQSSSAHQYQSNESEHEVHCSTPVKKTTTPRSAPKSINCRTPSRKKTTFSLVSDDIVQFQKLLLDLEDVLETSTTNPADQWRFKILVGSAEELASTIQHKLIRHRVVEEMECTDHDRQTTTPAKKAAHMKLKRDFRRMNTKFHGILNDIRKKQLQDIGNLLYADHSAIDTSILSSHEQKQHDLVRQREDKCSNIKIMREGETEITNVNRKIRSVNEIYYNKGRSLAINNNLQKAVIGRVDENSPNNNNSRANNNEKYGLEQLEQARAKANSFFLGKKGGTGKSVSNGGPKISWNTPFQTLQEDMEDVRRDLSCFGSGVMGVSITKLKMAKTLMFGNCAPRVNNLSNIYI